MTNSSTLLIQFKLDLSIKAPTEIFINSEFFYPNGYSLVGTADGVNLSDQRDFKVRESSKNYIQFEVLNPAFDGYLVDMIIYPDPTAANPGFEQI